MEIRQTCEHCNKALPNDSNEAMVCSFDCTFCKDCVDNILLNVCPNCDGGFEKRPTRPARHLSKHPIRPDIVYKPINFDTYQKRQDKMKDIDPRKR